MASPLRRIDAFAVGSGIALSLVGGWVLNPAGFEREVLATRVRRLGWFCRSGDFDPRTVGVEGLRDALRRFRSEMLERDDDDDGSAAVDPLQQLKSELEWLRAAPPRTRDLATQGFFERPLDPHELQRLLADIESASRRVDA